MTQAYNLAILANAVNTSGQLNVGTNATGTLPVANGGTGQSALTANNVVLGNGTSGVQFVAPSTNGNVLTSNGTTWVSQAPAGGGVTSLNGQTGAITNTSTNTIGSYCIAWRYTGFFGSMSYGSTLAGSSLRMVGSGGPFDPFQDVNNGVSLTNPSLSGTWRAMTTVNSQDIGCGSWRTWAALWVRVS